MTTFPAAVTLFLSIALQPTVPAAGFQPSSVHIHEHSNDVQFHPSKLATSIFQRTSPLSAALEHIDDSNMNHLLFCPDKGRPRSVLVDAFTSWCGPCKLIEPYLVNCATNHSGKLSVLKYNVEDPNTKNLKVEMLLQGVMIRGLPTLVLYHDGKPLATHSGAITENELNAWLDEHLFSKIDTFEAGQELGGEVAKKKVPGSKNASAKRGFVSMTSQFGSDDYMLSNV